MLLYICLLCSTVRISQTQFPPHMDFQKVGEVKFKNEKYNVLKPSTHIITDYFKDFMMRRDTSDITSEKVLMDHNGFRHFWTDFEDKTKDARKSDATEVESADPMPQEDNNQDENVQEETEPTTTKRTRRPRPTTISKSELAKIARQNMKERAEQELALRQASGKQLTLVQTTFFCPFFGVMATNHYIESAPRSGTDTQTAVTTTAKAAATTTKKAAATTAKKAAATTAKKAAATTAKKAAG